MRFPVVFSYLRPMYIAYNRLVFQHDNMNPNKGTDKHKTIKTTYCMSSFSFYFFFKCFISVVMNF